MGLLGQPAEVLLFIIDAVTPDDLVNFVLTCHKIYEHASERLTTHRYLTATYRHVTIDGDATDHTGSLGHCRHAASLLCRIQQDAHIAYYVRSIDFNPGVHLQPTNEMLQELHSLDLDSLLARWMHDKEQRVRLKRLMLYEMQENDPAPWASHFNNGESEAVAAFAILLSMLVNLTSMSLQNLQGYHAGSIDEVLQAIRPWEGENQAIKPLAKVHSIYVRHGDMIFTTKSLIYLPSLRELTGELLQVLRRPDPSADSSTSTQLETSSKVSRITKVDIIDSGVDSDTLWKFVQPMHQLERLQFHDCQMETWSELARYRKDFVKLAGEWLKANHLVAETAMSRTGTVLKVRTKVLTIRRAGIRNSEGRE